MPEDEKDEKGDAHSAREERGQASPEADQEAGAEKTPPVDFISFVLSLYSSVLVNIGDLPDPITGTTEVRPDMARQTIEVLALLEEKTRGNLTDEERHLFENVLPDLKLRYLKAIKYLT